MYGALIRKEVRLLRPVIIAALLVAVFCEVVIPGFTLFDQVAKYGVRDWTKTYVIRDLQWGAVCALCLSCGLAAVLGCAGATVERRERWAELNAMLPMSATRRTLIRLLTAAAIAAGLIGFHMGLMSFAERQIPQNWRMYSSGFQAYVWLAPAMFGFAWFAAAFLRSAAIAASSAIGLVVASLIVLLLVQDFAQARGMRVLYEPAYFRVMATLGVVAIVAGTVCSIRRVEP